MRPPLRPLAPFLVCTSLFAAEDPSAWVGTWRGDLDAGGLPIPTVFHLALEDGALGGTVDSPAQNVFGLEITAVTFAEDGTATVTIGAVGARYVAKREDGALVGTWAQRGVELPLVCAREEAAEGTRVSGQERFVGSWEGRLDVGGQSLRLRFHLKEDAAGRLIGTMDSPDQGARDLPLTRVAAEPDGRLEVELKSAGVRFSGALEEGGERCAGEFRQGGLELPLVLARIDPPAPVRRPQTPKPPFPYGVEEVAYENEEADVTIAGTLTVPEGDVPFPAALLITGSGPQDRDETLFDHKPFLVLADHLTRRGVCVLRVDDRGVGGTSAGSPDATSEDLAGDVLAGVRFLRGRAEVDPARVGLVGHSEGGLIAPMVAVRAPDEVAYLVLLAGPGVTGEEILLEQAALLTRAEGGDEESIAANRRLQEVLFEVLKEHPDASRADLTIRLRKAFAANEELLPEGASADALIAQQVQQLSSPWMRFFLTYDPRPTLASVRCPVLAVNGEKDLQVPSRLNLDAIGAALREGGSDDVTLLELPSLNHLFQTCETGAFSEYDAIEETFAETALDRIADWIVERFGEAG
ncbi:MAG: alpha/beta hydrolase family protein [Planctomycetota bacterium JB042]